MGQKRARLRSFLQFVVGRLARDGQIEVRVHPTLVPLDQMLASVSGVYNAIMVEGDIVVQTVQVMANLKAILAAVGLTLKDVVKTTVYLADLADFQEMNRADGEFFPQHPPARTTIQVAGLPRNVSVEIDAIAVKTEWSA